MTWRERIVSDSDICHGQPCIIGTRIPVSVVLDNLAQGKDAAEIAAEYPKVTAEDVQAALAYASELARERHSWLGADARQQGKAFPLTSGKDDR